MIKSLPDKWIRKAITDAFNGSVVDGQTINAYDTNITNDGNTDTPRNYVLMTTQSNEVDKADKCEHFWDSYILLDIITTYKRKGNQGSRLLADNILDELREALVDLQLDAASGLEIINQRMSFPSDLHATNGGEIIYRKFLRLNLYIK